MSNILRLLIRKNALILLIILFSVPELAASVNTVKEGTPEVQYLSQVNGLLKKRVTFIVTNERLEEVMEKLSVVTGANFVYGDGVSNVDKISINVEDATLESILDMIFEGQEVGFTVINRNHVVIARQNTLEKKQGRIKGFVKDESGEPLCGANVMIMETKYGCATCPMGSFVIKNLEPGEYTVKASFIGYEPQEIRAVVKAGKTTELNFTLKAESFKIGGIQVTGTRELLPNDVNTKTVIESGEIEHYQATNLGDVLNLVPGIQKSDNPGLNKTGQVAVRGDESDPLSAFGTLIIVDGVPQSNNANLQFETLSGSKFGNSTMGKGVDLRTIPADNLEKIEVMSGLPSVRYGDFTAGIINITTKMGAAPHRVKFKNNPHTSEGNIGGGFDLMNNNSLSYNMNIARSERDIRLTGDEYTRYTAQLVYSTFLMGKSLSSNFKVNGQAVNDEEEPKEDMSLTKNYNRGYTLGFSTWGKYQKPDAVSSFDYNAYITMERVQSRKSRLVQSDLRVLPNGDTVSAYMGAVRNEGREWTAGGRLEWQNVYFTGSYIHKFLAGGEVKYDNNTGEGVIIDSVYNYYGPDSPMRNRSFDDIPGQTMLSLYAEDKVTGSFIFDFSFMLGFRYEMYRPQKFNLSGIWGDGNLVDSYQGTFFNPRASLMLYLTEDLQMRMSAGKTSKSPPMSRLYPMPEIFQWRNPQDELVHNFMIDRTQADLKGYQETQYELSWDYRLKGLFGTTLSGYYKERSNQPVAQSVPYFFEYINSGRSFVYFIDTYSKEENIGRYYSKGIELSVRSARIDKLNMNFSITGSYNFVKNPGSGYSYDYDPDATLGQFPNYHVPGISSDTLIGWRYKSSGNWNDEIQMNYYVKYTHPTLGLWVTFRAEQIVKERRRSFDLVPIDYSYITDPTTLEETRATRAFQEAIKIKPNKWLFSVNVSKSLFDGAEVSFYVNNFLDDPAIRRYYTSTATLNEEKRNPDLFYGLEFSMVADKLFR